MQKVLRKCIRWIMEKAREFQKNIYYCFIDYDKAFDCVKLWELVMDREAWRAVIHGVSQRVGHAPPDRDRRGDSPALISWQVYSGWPSGGRV